MEHRHTTFRTPEAKSILKDALLYYLELRKEIPGYGVAIGLFTTWKLKIKRRIELRKYT